MFKAEGLITPVVTALNEKEEFNKAEYATFIDHLIEAGVSGIFPKDIKGMEFNAFLVKEEIRVH
jgi:4-hydroxy-tetrahydrodipicolinate synthase